MTKRILSLLLPVWLIVPIRAAATFTRPAMIESMANKCVVRGLDEMAAGAKKLSEATLTLQQHPSTNSLAGAQQAWITLFLTFKQNAMLTRGPDTGNTSWTMLFFPETLPASIEKIVQGSKTIDADFIEILGATAKGAYALEYLLFDSLYGAGIVGQTNTTPRFSARKLLEDPLAERRRLYVRELARDMESQFNAAVKGAKAPAFVPKFVAGDQDSINLLINQVIDCLETELLQKVQIFTNQLQAAQLRYEMIDGTASGTALSAIKASLEGARKYYCGSDGLGIDDYVQSVNPALASRLEKQFDAATRSVNALKEPLHNALLHQRADIERFLEETRKLEQLLKVDAISALGATLMFGSNDGD